MTKKLKKRIKRTALGAVIYVLGLLYSNFIPNANVNMELIIFLIAYFIVGGDIVKAAIGNIGHGQLFDENFLMTVATVGAFFVGSYPEAVAVMVFYQVGECFQSYAVNSSRKSIAELMDIRPDYANVVRNGKVEQTEPESVEIGEMIEVRPGERIPLDGTVIEGNTSLDTMALTGESIPRDVKTGEDVISGCVNINGVIRVQVSKAFGESTVAKILDLVENATSKKAETENFITKFARYYTPIVCFAALAVAVIPSIITGNPSVWIYRALSFLVISCPCALVISVPLSFFGGIGGASKVGILIKGSNYLEALAEAEMVAMDKTGTLTKGIFALQKAVPAQNTLSFDALIEKAAYIESYSNHPISKSILKAYGKEIDQSRLSEMEEIAGHGVKGKLDGKIIFAGNTKLMEQEKISYSKFSEIGTVVHLAEEGNYLGYLVIADEIKEDAKDAVEKFYHTNHMKKVVMLTGDRKETALAVAKNIGIKDVYAELLPGDKVDQVEKLMREKSEKGKLIFVGDGINDAPVLARADIGVAMGGLGSDAAIEAADVVIMNDEPSKISKAIQISKRTLVIVKQNIIFAIGVKVIILLLAAVGIASMWAAIFADVGVAVIAILNSMRALKV